MHIEALACLCLEFPTQKSTTVISSGFFFFFIQVGSKLELIFVSTFHSLVTCKVIIIYFEMRDVLVLNRLLMTRVQISIVFQSFCELKDELQTILF